VRQDRLPPGRVGPGTTTLLEGGSVSDFDFSHEEINTGGTKYPTRVHLRAHHPDGSDAGSMHYFPPKRKGSPVTVDTLPHGDDRARGAGSALLDEMERRHPGSRVVYMDELHEKNKPKPGDPNFNANRDYGLPTDWEHHFPKLPGQIHRGMGVRLDKYTAGDINSGDMPSGDQAKILRGAIENGGPGGMHWSADESKSHQFAHRNVIDPRTDIPVVLHARTPGLKDVETRPDVLRNKGVWPHDHISGDAEVPIRKKRPVHITGISWLPDADHPEADEHGWVHHTFAEPLVHNASQGLAPRILGNTLGESHERGRNEHRAGRGKPRHRVQPGAGDDSGRAGELGGDAGDVGAGQAAERPVTFHPQAAKEFGKLDGQTKRQVQKTIDALSTGQPTQTHYLDAPLKGWQGTKASRGHRIVHKDTDDGGLHIGYVGLHDYEKAERRLGAREPFEFEYARNTIPAPKMPGDVYGQDIEPHGRYMTVRSQPGNYVDNERMKWEFGQHRFENPLHLDAEGWKQHLSDMHGGKTGRELSQAVRDAGHDGIVTHETWRGQRTPGEIVDLTGFKRRSRLARTAADDDDDYRMQHRPPDADFGAPHHDLTQILPDDVYTHPQYYDPNGQGGDWHDRKTFQDSYHQIQRTRDKPEAKVKIYRSLPAEYAHQGFRPGDWVSTSRDYAIGHGKHHADSKHDWPVISTSVPAKHLQTSGDDLREWGYTGPHKEWPAVSHKGGYHQEIRQRADGTIAPVKRRAPKEAADRALFTEKQPEDMRNQGGTDWDRVHPTLPSTVHRGAGFLLSPKDHAYVHDASIPAADRAHHLIGLMKGKAYSGGIGKHWSTDPWVAHHFAANEAGRNSDAYETEAPDYKWGTDDDGDPKWRPATMVMLHAKTPARADLDETHHDVWGRGVDYETHHEKETPVIAGRPVHVTGMSWGTEDDPAPDDDGEPQTLWQHHEDDYDGPADPPQHAYPHRHTFPGGQAHTATWEDETYAGWEPHQRAVSEAQEAVRAEHPYLTAPLPDSMSERDEELRKVLRHGGHPRADDAYVHIHRDPNRSSSNSGISRETGAPIVSLHPSRADRGTITHEAAHILNDHDHGRQVNEEAPDHYVHGIGFAQHYARMLQPYGPRTTPGGNYKPGAGDLFLNTYYRSLAKQNRGFAHTAARALPTDRIFGPTYGLDHRLFNGEVIRPEVRKAVMDRLDEVFRVTSGLLDWSSYMRVYLAGSEASEWTSPTLEGNNDFDTLIGVDYDQARAHRDDNFLTMTDGEIDDVLNDILRQFYNDEDWQAPFGGVWHLTGYVNPDAYDIRDIKPYAAYDLSDSRWAVKPPHLPSWGPESFPEGPALWHEASAVADYIESILELPEPYRTQQGGALYDHLHSDRHRAFGPNGEGWYDPGNVIEKYLDQLGLWAKLLHLKKNAEHGAYDPGEQPMLEATALRVYHGTSAENAAKIKHEGLTSPVYDETHNTLSESRSQALELARRRGRQDPAVVAFDVPDEAVGEHLHPPYEYWGGSGVANTYALRKPLPPHFVATAKVANSDGDDWMECDQGHEHWGTNGAAGLLLRHHDPEDGKTRYLLQKRSPWVDHPDTWGIPGGALGHGEHPLKGAFREGIEELGTLPPGVRRSHTTTDDHGGWAYHTVVADSPERFEPGGGQDDHESDGHGWFTHGEMQDLPLHPGFAKSWDRVRTSHPGNSTVHAASHHWIANEHNLRGPGELEDEDEAPAYFHGDRERRNGHFDRAWDHLRPEQHENIRKNLKALSAKKMIVGTNHAAEIFDHGQMKTLHEYDPHERTAGYLFDRKALERHVLGVPESTNPDQQPIYGSMHDDPVENNYGRYKLELKPHVRARAGVTMGDSLNEKLRGYHIDHVPHLSHAEMREMVEPTELINLAENEKPKSYMEFQVHGGIGVHDIAKLHVHEDHGRPLTEKDHQVMDKARDAGVEVVHHKPDPNFGLTDDQVATLRGHR
jgi:ADP-ribose pyrophosphatase YjhB (NUDIX family)